MKNTRRYAECENNRSWNNAQHLKIGAWTTSKNLHSLQVVQDYAQLENHPPHPPKQETDSTITNSEDISELEIIQRLE